MATRLRPPLRVVAGHRFTGRTFPALTATPYPRMVRLWYDTGCNVFQRGEIGVVTRAGTARMTAPEPMGSGCCGSDK